MSRLSDIYKAYISEMKTTIQQSELLLQKQNSSLSGELKTSGKICEDFIKRLITNHLPDHLRATSGYIIDPEKKHNDDNLPQFDLLIVDKHLPPLYKFNNFDIEVVPVEAICGVFEIKRHIDNKNIKDFVSKLNSSVLKYSGLSKQIIHPQNAVNIANLTIGIFNPIIGIISLTSNITKAQLLDSVSTSILDMIWSIDGTGLLPFQRHGAQSQFLDFFNRPKNNSFNNITKEEWQAHLKTENPPEILHIPEINKEAPEEILSAMIGWLTYTFFRLSGRHFDIATVINSYFTGKCT